MLVMELLEARQLLATYTVDFGDLALDPESHWDGPDPSGAGSPVVVGSFRSGAVVFKNSFDESFGGFWKSDFAYSNETDTVTAGFGNRYSSFAGGGNGDANFGLSFGYKDIPFDVNDPSQLAQLPNFTLPEGAEIQRVYITNTTYAALSMRDGDDFAKKFGGNTGNDPDWFKVTAYGTDANGAVITGVAPEFYLADYREADNLNDYIIDTWQAFDLSGLAGARTIYFNVSSSDVGSFGLNTPAYFAIDDIVYTANTAPTLNTAPDPQLATIEEDGTNLQGTLVADLLAGAVSDPDVGAMEGMAIVSASSAGGTWQYSLDSGTTWLDLLTHSETEARLLPADNLTRIRFFPEANFSGESTIRYRAWDQTEGTPGGILSTLGRAGGSGTFSEEIETAFQTIQPLNDAPVLDNTLTPSLGSVLEDAKNPTGTLIKYLARTAITDVDENAVQGLAVISAYGGNGDWQFSLDSVHWQSMTGASETFARLLPVDETARIRFVPKTNYVGDAWISYRAWDQTEGNAGETLDTQGRKGLTKTFSTATEAVKISVTPINDAPVLDNTLTPSLGSVLVNAKNPRGTLIKYLARNAITDVDDNALQGLAIVSAYGGNGDWQFSLDSVTWQSMTGASESSARLLPVNETTRIRFVPKANYIGDAWIRYRAWDQTEGNPGETLSTLGRKGLTKTFSTATEAVKVTVVAKDASLVSLGGSVGYVRNEPRVLLSPSAQVNDQRDFAGEWLKVRIASGRSNSNLLAIGGGFTVDETLKVHQRLTHIGNLNPGGGDGTTDLIVTFNSNATKAIVQDLVRAITFRTFGGSVGTRTIKFSLSDGKHEVSVEATKTVNVT